MAEKLESYDFSWKGGQPRDPRYDQWLDGGIYKLVLGEDCSEYPDRARACLYNAARRRGKKVRVHGEDGFLIVQAYDRKGA